MRICTLSRALTVAVLSLAVCLPVQASLIDFEDAAPTLFAGSSIASGGYTFTSSGSGFSGVDNAGAFVFGNAPANSDGQFLFGLNADVLTMSLGGASFRLLGFDASFIAPLSGLGANLSAGRLFVSAVTASGLFADDFDFGLSDANGNWSFSSITTNALASGVTSVSFSACVYAGNGCSFTDPLSQFAIDNLRVPEPGTAMLVLAALGILAARRRSLAL